MLHGAALLSPGLSSASGISHLQLFASSTSPFLMLLGTLTDISSGWDWKLVLSLFHTQLITSVFLALRNQVCSVSATPPCGGAMQSASSFLLLRRCPYRTGRNVRSSNTELVQRHLFLKGMAEGFLLCSCRTFWLDISATPKIPQQMVNSRGSVQLLYEDVGYIHCLLLGFISYQQGLVDGFQVSYLRLSDS